MNDDSSSMNPEAVEAKLPIDANQEMLEEILGQPDSLATSLPELRRTVKAMSLQRPAESSAIYLTGCGDGSWLSQAVRHSFEMNLSCAIHALPAMEVAGYAPLRRGDTVILMSVSGEVPRTVEAMESARAASAITIAVTANRDSVLATGCDHCMLLPAQAKSLHTPHSLNYTITMMGLWALLEGFCRQRFYALDDSPEIVAATISEARPACEQFAALNRLSNCHWFLGAGPHWGTAMYAAAKWWTASGMSSQCLEMEDMVHGGHLILRPDHVVGLIATPGRSLPRAHEMIPGLLQLGTVPLLIGSTCDLPGIQSLPARQLTEDLEPWAPLPIAAIVQLLCWASASVRGFDVLTKHGDVPDPALYDVVHRSWRNESQRRPRL